MMIRQIAAISICMSAFASAYADGLTPAAPAAAGVCYASGSSGSTVPCIQKEQTWVQVLRPTDIARSMSDRAGEIVNGGDYFACDGNSDIRSGLVAAISAAVPRPLYIPPQSGKCLLSAGVSLKSGLAVYAERGTVTLAPSAANTNGTVLLNGTLVDNVRVEGLGFDGGGQDFANSSSLVVLYRANNVIFDKTDWSNSRGSALLGSNINDSGVTNSTFYNIGNHWRSTGSINDRSSGVNICCNDVSGASYGNNNFVRWNKFTDIGLDAISSSQQTSFSADQNKCIWTYVQSAAIAAPDYPACVYDEYSSGFVAVGNTSYMSPGNAFDLKGTVRFTLTANISEKSGQAGISVNGNVGTITGNSLTNGVQWSGSVQKGAISFFDGQNVSVSGNVAIDTQTNKTQIYGIWGQIGSNRAGAIIDQSNALSGNAAAPLGGGITAYGAQ